ncbi:hypothetical protein IE077_003300 [Cardiosporidium cionae]|uniref:Uncharacterized protein n=1 Tax=Cardiosporidium cionae TaxID=476202 RepID=A0ABQ7J8J2_9APIC|nr:hypothetical protein IE077_003300 [Cardiosporidium cionae]|eukprot:KAF8820313.1 hypothetical protein IE077_003300 [Cardiosporidium cionae]
MWIVDEEMFATELFRKSSDCNEAIAFYDLRRVRLSSHWRIQKDLALIYAAANSIAGDSTDTIK